MAITGNISDETGDIMLMEGTVNFDGLIQLASFTDTTVGESGARVFLKEFRYSTDNGSNYSPWIELTPSNVSTIQIDSSVDGFFIAQYRYESQGIGPGETLQFNSVQLSGTTSRSFMSVIRNLTERFYPTGWAFRETLRGIRGQVTAGLLASENRAATDAYGVLFGILPDNDNFTIEDAELWESRLGLASGSALTLEIRKDNIARKIQHPGDVGSRSSDVYLEGQLQAAGFNLFVHENLFPDGSGGLESRSYPTVVGAVGIAVHSPLVEHGTIQHGGTVEDVVINSLDPVTDSLFNIGTNYERTFFIGGSTLPQFATVPANRREELRHLILTVKPTHLAAYLLINYV